MHPSVRSARPADAPAVRALQSLLEEPSPAAVSAALGDPDRPPSTERPSPTGSPSSAAPNPAFRLLVSVDADDRPVGYLLALDGEPTHIVELAVAPAFRRAGRATALLSTLLASATPPVSVHVAADNAAARACYASLGFVEAARSETRFETATALTFRYEPSPPSSP